MLCFPRLLISHALVLTSFCELNGLPRMPKVDEVTQESFQFLVESFSAIGKDGKVDTIDSSQLAFEIWLAAGDHAFKNHDYLTAIMAYQAVLTTLKPSQAALFRAELLHTAFHLGESMMALQHEQACDWFSAILDHFQPEYNQDRATITTRLGDCLFATKRHKMALNAWEASDELMDDPSAGRELGTLVPRSAAPQLKRSLIASDSVCMRNNDTDDSWMVGTVLHTHSLTSMLMPSHGQHDLQVDECYRVLRDSSDVTPSVPYGSLCINLPNVAQPQWVTTRDIPERRISHCPATIIKTQSEFRTAEIEERLVNASSALARSYLPKYLALLWDSEGHDAPLLQSEALRNTSDAMAVNAFKRRGYAIVENTIPRDRCDAVVNWITKFRTRQSTRAWEVSPAQRRQQHQFIKSNMHRDKFALELNSSLTNVVQSLFLEDSPARLLLRHLAKPQAIVHDLAVFVVHPGAAMQDIHAVAAPIGTNVPVSFLVVLNDVEPGQGNLHVWPGSHNAKRIEEDTKIIREGVARTSARTKGAFRGLELAPLKAGTLLAYSQGLIHAGGANLLDVPGVVMHIILAEPGSHFEPSIRHPVQTETNLTLFDVLFPTADDIGVYHTPSI